MPKIKTVLIDLSGTLHIADRALPGAIEALQRLRTHCNVKFVTNTTKESRRLLHLRVENCGFDIGLDEIYTSLTACRELIDRENLRPFLILDDAALEEFEGVDTQNPNAVVIGLAPDKYTSATMDTAFRLIKQEGAQLIAIHKGRYYMSADGLRVGPGLYVHGLEFATGAEARVVGKPEKRFFQMALDSLGEDIDPRSVVMIGDDVVDDVRGSIEAGFRGVLVKTGKYREGDEEGVTNVAESFAHAVNMILEDRIQN